MIECLHIKCRKAKASNGKYACRENAIAITKLEEALHWLYSRRMEREIRQVQGLNKQ